MQTFRALAVVTTLLTCCLLGSGYAAAPNANAAAKPDKSLAGEWVSDAGGTPAYYDFDAAGKNNFNGYVVDGGCAGVPSPANWKWSCVSETETSFSARGRVIGRAPDVNARVRRVSTRSTCPPPGAAAFTSPYPGDATA